MRTDDRKFLSILLDAREAYRRGAHPERVCRDLDMETWGRFHDRSIRDALHEILNDLHRGSSNKLDGYIDLIERDMERDPEYKHIRYARAYNADSRKLQELHALAMQPVIEKCFALMAEHNLHIEPITVNKTSTELFAEAQAAASAEAQAEAAATKAAHVEYLKTLANATLHLLNAVSGGALSDSCQRVLVKFRKELQPLANELGYRIVFIGDRSTAVLVQQ